MELFQIKEYAVTYSPQALLLKPFKTLWTRDRSKSKSRAIFELGYVWFMEDYKSDFADLADPDYRHENVIKAIDVPKGWKPDKAVIEAQKFYNSFYNYYNSYQALENAKLTLKKVSDFITSVDPDERNNNGSLVFNIKQLADTAKAIPDLLESIKKCELALKKDMEVDNGMRGSQEKSMFETGV